jgi:hypothetical protein
MFQIQKRGGTMKYIWAVSMGIGENVSERRAMRIFSDKKSAYAWVAKHFADDLLSVKNHADRDWDDGVTIGNSFAVRRMEVEEGEGNDERRL